MSTLHDRLVDLASDAPEGSAAPGLWDRGLRYRRRRRAGTAAVLVVALAAIAGLGSVTWSRSPRSVEPLPAGSPAGLPDRLYDVSPWLPGTDEAGELGRLAAVLPALRGSWTRTRAALAGVSAVTGEYRFLDLPGARPDAAQVSPDGRFLAYAWADEGREVGIADGVALYDAETGEVRRYRLPGDLGSQVGDLLWAGPDTLVIGVSTVTESGDGFIAGVGAPVLSWPVGDAEPHSLGTERDLQSAGPGTVLLRGAGSRYVIVDSRTGAQRATFVLEEQSFPVVVDPAGARVAALQADRTPGVLRVGDVATSPVTLADVTDEPGGFDLLGWTDDEQVIAVWRRGLDQPDADVALVDPATGAVDVVVERLPFPASVATDLVSEPTVPAVRPADPVDPRRALGLGAAIVLAAALALLWWRQRVRP